MDNCPIRLICVCLSMVFTFTSVVFAEDDLPILELNTARQCMKAATASTKLDDLTLGELRQQCATSAGRTTIANLLASPEPILTTQTAVTEPDTPDVEETGVAQQRIDDELEVAYNPFTMTAHRRNYLLPVTYNTNTHAEPFEISDDEVNHTEVKFQFSFKVPLWNNIIGDADLWGAYTNLSFWQAYNNSNSSPFRETNHEPELFIKFNSDLKLFGFTNTSNSVGIVHQSNGQHDLLSRSWNRIYLSMTLERNNLVLNFKPWYRIPEDEKESSTSAAGDDNPNIEKYLGYGELSSDYKWNEQVFSVMWRNNLRASNNKGAIQLDWTFPLTRRLKGYVQYFNGYGESLIDYNASVNRLGIGLVLTDAL